MRAGLWINTARKWPMRTQCCKYVPAMRTLLLRNSGLRLFCGALGSQALRGISKVRPGRWTDLYIQITKLSDELNRFSGDPSSAPVKRNGGLMLHRLFMHVQVTLGPRSFFRKLSVLSCFSVASCGEKGGARGCKCLNVQYVGGCMSHEPTLIKE